MKSFSLSQRLAAHCRRRESLEAVVRLNITSLHTFLLSVTIVT